MPATRARNWPPSRPSSPLDYRWINQRNKLKPVLDLTIAEARRIAVRAQGFARPRPKREASARQIADVIRRLGLIQLDFVNVLVPAHYLVVYSRLGPYSRARFDDVVYASREFTEQWAHEASIVPVSTWPLLRHRMETHRVRPWGFEEVMAKHPGYVHWILEHIGERGPLSAADLPAPEGLRERTEDGWSSMGPRAILEAHFGRGALAVTKRLSNFSRTFDLAERVLPEVHYRKQVSREDSQRELLRVAAKASGVGTLNDLADHYRMPVGEARPRVAELVEAGELCTVRVEGWKEAAYLHKDAVGGKVVAAALLSPFDPLVWFRPRAERLFDFEYRIEIYTPEAKRKWGYYCLPFLMGERIVARVDLRAERKERVLVVAAAHLEAHADKAVTAAALMRELRLMAKWLGLDSIRVSRRGNLARALAAVRESA
jgi:uncharacterized protein YcaQ